MDQSLSQDLDAFIARVTNELEGVFKETGRWTPYSPPATVSLVGVLGKYFACFKEVLQGFRGTFMVLHDRIDTLEKQRTKDNTETLEALNQLHSLILSTHPTPEGNNDQKFEDRILDVQYSLDRKFTNFRDEANQKIQEQTCSTKEWLETIFGVEVKKTKEDIMRETTKKTEDLTSQVRYLHSQLQNLDNTTQKNFDKVQSNLSSLKSIEDLKKELTVLQNKVREMEVLARNFKNNHELSKNELKIELEGRLHQMISDVQQKPIQSINFKNELDELFEKTHYLQDQVRSLPHLKDELYRKIETCIKESKRFNTILDQMSMNAAEKWKSSYEELLKETQNQIQLMKEETSSWHLSEEKLDSIAFEVNRLKSGVLPPFVAAEIKMLKQDLIETKKKILNSAFTSTSDFREIKSEYRKLNRPRQPKRRSPRRLSRERLYRIIYVPKKKVDDPGTIASPNTRDVQGQVPPNWIPSNIQSPQVSFPNQSSQEKPQSGGLTQRKLTDFTSKEPSPPKIDSFEEETQKRINEEMRDLIASELFARKKEQSQKNASEHTTNFK